MSRYGGHFFVYQIVIKTWKIRSKIKAMTILLILGVGLAVGSLVRAWMRTALYKPEPAPEPVVLLSSAPSPPPSKMFNGYTGGWLESDEESALENMNIKKEDN